MRGYKAGRFSFNVHGGRCEACQGQGQLRIEMQFLPISMFHVISAMGHDLIGKHFRSGSREQTSQRSLIQQSNLRCRPFSLSRNRLQTKMMNEVGLGYVRIGQPAPTLSGGEAQRVKLAKELSRRSTGRTIYVLDEPSVGLHAADVHRLVDVLQRLVEGGNTVLIIEHNLDIIKVSDYIIDLGPRVEIVEDV